MSEQYLGCLDKMSEVNFSPAETLGALNFEETSLTISYQPNHAHNISCKVNIEILISQLLLSYEASRSGFTMFARNQKDNDKSFLFVTQYMHYRLHYMLIVFVKFSNE